jgi:hypothetical protein
MSWHGARGKPDPYERPVLVGEVLGPWEVLGPDGKDPHYGVLVRVRCRHCGMVRGEEILSQLRSDARRKPTERVHIGCSRLIRRRPRASSCQERP